MAGPGCFARNSVSIGPVSYFINPTTIQNMQGVQYFCYSLSYRLRWLSNNKYRRGFSNGGKHGHQLRVRSYDPPSTLVVRIRIPTYVRFNWEPLSVVDTYVRTHNFQFLKLVSSMVVGRSSCLILLQTRDIVELNWQREKL